MYHLQFAIQEGYLADQDAPATDGKRSLRYDVQTGSFLLTTTSYARVRCDMNFRLYPFDTQECRFTINARMNIDYMVETDNTYQIR